MKHLLIRIILLLFALNVNASVDPRFEPTKLKDVFEVLSFEKVENVIGSWILVGESYQKGSYQMSKLDFNGLGTQMQIDQTLVHFINLDSVETYELSSELFNDFGNGDYLRYFCKYQKTPIETILCNGQHGSGRTSYKCFVRVGVNSMQSCLFP